MCFLGAFTCSFDNGEFVTYTFGLICKTCSFTLNCVGFCGLFVVGGFDAVAARFELCVAAGLLCGFLRLVGCLSVWCGFSMLSLSLLVLGLLVMRVALR